MTIEVLPDADSVAERVTAIVAAEARPAIAARGRFLFAVSGRSRPWRMLRALADEDVPWNAGHIVQVDERVAPAGDTSRNLTHLRASLLEHAPMPPGHLYAMPVEEANLEAAARSYAGTLQRIAGMPAVLDFSQLGLGPDGHTASLVPGDPVLEAVGRDVALTGVYQGRRRITDVSDAQPLPTYPVAGDRGGEGRNVGAFDGLRCIHSRRASTSGPGVRAGRQRSGG